MKFITTSILTAAAVVAIAGTAQAQYFVDLNGTPIMGTNAGDYSVTGSEGNQIGQEPPVNMTDGSVNTGDQTFGSIAYAGINNFTKDPVHPFVTAVKVNFELFYDGGWFGPNGADALNTEEQASGGTMQAPIEASDLSLPTLQVTTNGTTWTNVTYSSNYTSQLEGIYHYNEAITPVVTFNLDTPAYEIKGIRLIGTTGGTSDFLGVSNFAVVAEVPEPSTYAMLLGGLAGLAFFVRRKGSMVK
jgi:hypothetical protein